MEQNTKTSNRLSVRIAALLLHAVLNFIIITWLTNFDLTGSWLVFIAFAMIVFVLIYFFLRHIVSFVQFLKNT